MINKWKPHKYGQGEFLYLAEGLLLSYSLDILGSKQYNLSLFGKRLKMVDTPEIAKKKLIKIAMSRLKRAETILKTNLNEEEWL